MNDFVLIIISFSYVLRFDFPLLLIIVPRYNSFTCTKQTNGMKSILILLLVLQLLLLQLLLLLLLLQSF